GNGQYGQSVRHSLGAQCRPLERIDGDIDIGPVADADIFADVEHRALVHLAFADNHAAIDVDLAQLLAHGVDGGLVSGLFVAATPQAGGGDGGGLRHACNLQHQDAIEPARYVVALDVVLHRTPLFPRADRRQSASQRLDPY